MNTVSGTATTTTLYLNDAATGAMSERVARGPTTPTNWNSFSWGAAPWGGVTANAMPTWVDIVLKMMWRRLLQKELQNNLQKIELKFQFDL